MFSVKCLIHVKHRNQQPLSFLLTSSALVYFCRNLPWGSACAGSGPFAWGRKGAGPNVAAWVAAGTGPGVGPAVCAASLLWVLTATGSGVLCVGVCVWTFPCCTKVGSSWWPSRATRTRIPPGAGPPVVARWGMPPLSDPAVGCSGTKTPPLRFQPAGAATPFVFLALGIRPFAVEEPAEMG